MKKYIQISFIFLFAFFLMACSPAEEVVETETEPAVITYTSESWKTEVSETCKHFSDGCNMCNRAEGSEVAACTRKMCQNYKAPKCLDEEEKKQNLDELMQVPDSATNTRKVVFSCKEGKNFLIHYNEYVSGDMILRLKKGMVVLSDPQEHTSTHLNPVESVIGEKYENDDGFLLEIVENKAVVKKDNNDLYIDCIITE